MKSDRKKRPLYRKVNTRARGVHHDFGGDFRHDRRVKKEGMTQTKGSMHGKKQRGLDYTPLFKFLLSREGEKWDEVYSEAKARLDKTEPIFWMVARNEVERKDYFVVSESTYFSAMYIDDDGILRRSKPELSIRDLGNLCTCCTHSLDGKVLNVTDRPSEKNN